jgi:ankyrin repeat protein
VRALLQAGASIGDTNDKGKTAKEIAVKYGHTEVVALFNMNEAAK